MLPRAIHNYLPEYINKALTVNAVAFHNEQHQSSHKEKFYVFLACLWITLCRMYDSDYICTPEYIVIKPPVVLDVNKEIFYKAVQIYVKMQLFAT
jgi:hypothetical protein